jgi:hypothetical protein
MIIATRELTLRQDAGDVIVPIRIHAPERDDRCWKCRYEVEWPDRIFASEAYGEDAVQAIELTMQKIGVELYVTEEHKAGRLGWPEPGDGFGFPVARTVRDLLVGHDRRFYGNDP